MSNERIFQWLQWRGDEWVWEGVGNIKLSALESCTTALSSCLPQRERNSVREQGSGVMRDKVPAEEDCWDCVSETWNSFCVAHTNSAFSPKLSVSTTALPAWTLILAGLAFLTACVYLPILLLTSQQ